MLLNRLTTVFVLLATLFGLAIAKHTGPPLDPHNPNPNCGAPFCARSAVVRYIRQARGVAMPRVPQATQPEAWEVPNEGHLEKE